MSKIEKIGIEAEDYPDWDYVINQLMRLADKQNEIIEIVNQLDRYTTALSQHIERGGLK